MKKINDNEFEINKSTMRDLTPYELDQVAGADCGRISTLTLTTLTLTTLTTSSPVCTTTSTSTTSSTTGTTGGGDEIA